MSDCLYWIYSDRRWACTEPSPHQLQGAAFCTYEKNVAHKISHASPFSALGNVIANNKHGAPFNQTLKYVVDNGAATNVIADEAVEPAIVGDASTLVFRERAVFVARADLTGNQFLDTFLLFRNGSSVAMVRSGTPETVSRFVDAVSAIAVNNAQRMLVGDFLQLNYNQVCYYKWRRRCFP